MCKHTNVLFRIRSKRQARALYEPLARAHRRFYFQVIHYYTLQYVSRERSLMPKFRAQRDRPPSGTNCRIARGLRSLDVLAVRPRKRIYSSWFWRIVLAQRVAKPYTLTRTKATATRWLFEARSKRRRSRGPFRTIATVPQPLCRATVAGPGGQRSVLCKCVSHLAVARTRPRHVVVGSARRVSELARTF